VSFSPVNCAWISADPMTAFSSHLALAACSHLNVHRPKKVKLTLYQAVEANRGSIVRLEGLGKFKKNQ
jgi:hypothetical protein